LGCGYLPVHIAAPEIAAGRLLARATAQGPVVAPIHLAWREPVRGRALAWFIQAFSRLALEG
jgi:DNA-binding transcriptional LysR family regulator